MWSLILSLIHKSPGQYELPPSERRGPRSLHFFTKWTAAFPFYPKIEASGILPETDAQSAAAFPCCLWLAAQVAHCLGELVPVQTCFFPILAAPGIVRLPEIGDCGECGFVQ